MVILDCNSSYKDCSVFCGMGRMCRDVVDVFCDFEYLDEGAFRLDRDWFDFVGDSPNTEYFADPADPVIGSYRILDGFDMVRKYVSGNG
jgi:hypothetical protein